MYEFFFTLYPKGIQENISRELNYATFKVRNDFFAGAVLFFSFGISLGLALQFAKTIFTGLNPILALIIVFFAGFIGLQFLVYMVLSIISTNKGKFIEMILPDALQLIAANLRAGMTIDRALMAANRPEFGYFNEQFSIVGKEISMGIEVSDALMNMTKRIKSKKFKKAIELIVTGMQSGGELSKLLGEVGENTVHQKQVEDKVKTNVTTYLLFIGAAVGFAAPILYGLSTVIVKVIVSTFASVSTPAGGSGTDMPLSINMTPELAEVLPVFIKTYAKVSLLTLAIMASTLLGQIKEGEAKYGVNYLPGLVIFCLIMYFGVSIAANALFSSILN